MLVQVWRPEGDPGAGPLPRRAASLQPRRAGLRGLVHAARHAGEQEYTRQQIYTDQ